MVSRVVFSQEKRPGWRGIMAGNVLSSSRWPFPPGRPVTFSSKDCVCQKCSLPQSAGSSEPLCRASRVSGRGGRAVGSGLCGAGRGAAALGAVGAG